MLRKFLFAAAGAGALGLMAAAVPAPAQATSLHVGSALGAVPADTNLVEVQRRRSERRGPPRGHRYHGHWRGDFWAAPFALVPPHPCYRWSSSRRGWVWDSRRCGW